MQNEEMNTSLSDNSMAFQMFRLRKKIEEVNQNEDDYDAEYVEELSSQRQDFLNNFYGKRYGDNICCLN